MRDETDSHFDDVGAEFRRVRTEVKSGFDATRQELSNVRDEMKTEFVNVRQEMNAEFVNVRHEMNAEFVAVRNEMKAEFINMRNEMKAGFDEVRSESRARLDELRRHMIVLHEDTLDRIASLAFDPAPLRREFQAADAAVRKDVNARLEPVEAFLRTHGGTKKRGPRR